MRAEPRCEEIRELLPELALDLAEGEQRASALEHLTTCANCRDRLGELSAIADDLLLLAPREEPPAGFETRVLDRVRPAKAPRRVGWLPRLLAPVAAAAIAVGATLLLAHRDDRDLASRYRETLAEVDGKYLAGERLAAAGGVEVGKVYGYEGDPSWVLVTVDGAGEMHPGRYRLELVTADGSRLPLRSLSIDERGGSAGQAIPIHFEDVAQVRVVGAAPGDVYESRFHAD